MYMIYTCTCIWRTCTVFVIYCVSKLHVLQWSFDAQLMTSTVCTYMYMYSCGIIKPDHKPSFVCWWFVLLLTCSGDAGAVLINMTRMLLVSAALTRFMPYCDLLIALHTPTLLFLSSPCTRQSVFCLFGEQTITHQTPDCRGESKV